MLVACWSVKGGSGTTVVAAALALILGPRMPGGVTLVDLAGDLPCALGIGTPGPGVFDWMAAGPAVPAEALRRLEVEIARGVRLIPSGELADEPGLGDGSAGRLLHALGGGAPVGVEGGGATVVDAGLLRSPSLVADVVAAATTSLLVLRPCYLALRRAVAQPARPTGVVLVEEKERALTSIDVEDALGVPVVAVVPFRPEIARAVDAGLLACRLPRMLTSSLRHAT